MRRLQRLLLHSWTARCLVVRIVTQDNRGKRTAGVDGVRPLTPAQRLALTDDLRLNQKARPTRRVWIPKPGSEEKRPLGIPTMRDQAEQTLVRLALEPEWEAHFSQQLWLSAGTLLSRCHRRHLPQHWTETQISPRR